MSASDRQYPTQEGAYAVKVKNGATWHGFDTVRLQISVGMPYHEDEKMAATINWVRHRFDHVVICVNDTLQRFNHQFDPGLKPRQAYKKSIQDGDEWIERYRGLIDTLPSAELHRWDDWMIWPDFASSMYRTQELYKNNREFREAIQDNIKAFWQRHTKKTGLTDAYRFGEFSALSERYLLEETAIFSNMFKQTKAVDVYPGTPLLPCTVFRGRNVKGAPEGLGQGTFTRIDFSRNKAWELNVA